MSHPEVSKAEGKGPAFLKYRIYLEGMLLLERKMAYVEPKEPITV